MNRTGAILCPDELARLRERVVFALLASPLVAVIGRSDIAEMSDAIIEYILGPYKNEQPR